MMSRLLSLLLLVVLAGAGYGAFRLVEAGLAADVYRDRLAVLSSDYDQLRQRYDEAVRRTAVTELRVHDGVLSVVIRTAEGELQTLKSPFDPKKEIYVDYVVADGRLWIRRIFDEDTAPGDGMVVDPRFVDVDWDAEGASHGKAAYRSLGEGRWIVDVTGDGSLGLSRREDDEIPELSPPPPVRDYEPVGEEVRDQLGSIRLDEAARVLWRQLGS